ncbi:MAG: cysteinyl-tRNA synthetase [Parcubacteria group bacterium Gr01-1014_46]|nr:MAG: cysteinyl-tRNA synthetase [Parcubacteria group bacterium Gr01-1014_46]
MKIFLQNTLTGEKEEFKPLKEGVVKMYNCGPTVYDYAHIGNFRTFIFSDILRRMFEYNNYKVDAVMNITDVDDKTIKRSQSEGVSLQTLTRKYEDLFFKDLASLNIERFPKTPRATESIPEMISLIEKMLENGTAYKSSDGVYFDIKKSVGYGKLANLKLENETKERIVNDEYDKENARDFSLWKFYDEKDGDVVFDAPFGKGRPGWHIECSAMSMSNLHTETIDIHTGGSDLIFPHHTNEIAQSEAVTGKTFVKYWMHSGFITVDGKKMSKSLGNIFTLENLKEKNIESLAYRYFVLGAHYSTLLNFTWETLDGAQTALRRLREKVTSFPDGGKVVETEFNTFINDDLDTPKALALIWDLIKDDSISNEDKRATILDFDRILGLKLDKKEVIEIPDEVKGLINERDKARASKDFAKSDELRQKIESLGFEIKDTKDGTEIS